MRLDKLIEETCKTSRKEMKRLLIMKRVRVDGVAELQGSRNVDPALQRIEIDGQPVMAAAHVYYMLNKPKGVVTAVSDAQHQTVVDLIAPADNQNLHPVGRLDRDTEGLLLLTNNGQLGYELLLPHKKVIKGYLAVVNDCVTQEDVDRFAAGIVFHGGITCKPAKLTVLSADAQQSRVYLEIQEGKFHQVKKMFLSCGKKVIYLKRVKMGPLLLDEELPAGHYRRLTSDELLALKHYFI